MLSRKPVIYVKPCLSLQRDKHRPKAPPAQYRSTLLPGRNISAPAPSHQEPTCRWIPSGILNTFSSPFQYFPYPLPRATGSPDGQSHSPNPIRHRTVPYSYSMHEIIPYFSTVYDAYQVRQPYLTRVPLGGLKERKKKEKKRYRVI